MSYNAAGNPKIFLIVIVIVITQTALAVGFLAVVFSSSMGGFLGYGDFGLPHFSLCFHSQNGSRPSKTAAFLGVVFFFCVRGVTFLTPFCTPPMQNAMFFYEKSRKPQKNYKNLRKISL